MNTETRTKQPYIPLYIGDWEQDTNCLTLEAEGALLKLIFKLWKSDDKGRAEFSFTQLSILLKKTEEITRKIVAELHENRILNIEFIGKDRVKFSSRRILKEIAKSLTYSENGSKGGRPKKANQKLTKSKTKPKQKQIPDNDIDNDYESVNENRKGGMGEKFNPFDFIPDTWDRAEFTECWTAHMDVRRKKKNPASPKACELMLKELVRVCPVWSDARGKMEAAIISGWPKYIYDGPSTKKTEPEGGRYAHERVTIFDKA